MARVQIAESVSVGGQTVLSVEDSIKIVVKTKTLTREDEASGSGVVFYALKWENVVSGRIYLMTLKTVSRTAQWA